jgi:type I restriction enzyme S subunit
MDQTNSKLPRGWALSRLEEIAMLNPRHPSELDPSIEVSFVPMPAVNENGWKLKSAQKRALGEVRKGYTHFANGDVLFAKITPCMENGKAAVAEDLANGLGCGTTELHVIRPVQDFQSRFLYYFVHREDFRKAARQNMTGTAGQLRVPLSFIKESVIPVPPTKEQIRIVAKLEKLLAKVDACKERLEKIPAILKRFRQSALAAACSGRLTEDWRKGPVEWVDTQIGDIFFDLSNGFSKRFGSQGEEVTVLRLADFSGNQRVYGKERKIRLTKEEQEKYTLDNNDILVVRVNGSREIAGRFILYEGEKEAYCDHFIRIKVDYDRRS